MSRNRRRQKPLWMTLAIWALVALVVGWGLWQFAEFRRTLIAQAQQSASDEEPAHIVPTQIPPIADPVPASAPANESPLAINASIPPVIAAPLAPIVATPPPAPTGDTEDPDDLIAKGTACLDNNRLVEGRAALNSALLLLEDDPRAPKLRRRLTDLNAGVFLGSAVLPEDKAALFITIEPGDSFLKLARQFFVPAPLLQIINPSLNPRNLKPLTGIKIIQGPFNIRLVKHAARLDLYLRELYIRSFAAQLEEGYYLPRGTYRIKPASKIQIGVRTWIGFHGVEPATREVTVGWLYGSPGPRRSENSDQTTGIKLADADLAQLYNVLVETHSTLRVAP